MYSYSFLSHAFTFLIFKACYYDYTNVKLAIVFIWIVFFSSLALALELIHRVHETNTEGRYQNQIHDLKSPLIGDVESAEFSQLSTSNVKGKGIFTGKTTGKKNMG